MSEDNHFEIKRKFWCPRFANAETERDFMLEFNSEALTVGRIGILVIIIAWSGFAWLDMLLAPPAKYGALFFRLLLITPIFIAILAATYTKRAVFIYQMIVVISVFIIEGSIVYVVTFYDLETISRSLGFAFPMQDADGKFIFVGVWLLVIFMATGIMRLDVIPAVLSGLVYIVFNLLSAWIYQPSALFAFIIAPFLITAVPVVWFGSLYVQRYARENYRSSKLLIDSMQRSESLLLNILPVPIADRLKKNAGTIADGFDSVSVLFADIVQFTQLSQRFKPDELVQMLNNIFSQFDHIAKKHAVEKIKTIGDAYMLAAGVPETRPDHCAAVADCALDMVAAAANMSDPKGEPIQIRVGIHTGPAIAGVIGAHKFAYDLWGDTVNTASRMESHGASGKIQTSKEIYQMLKDDFLFEFRDSLHIKGKGAMQTWWLIGRRNV